MSFCLLVEELGNYFNEKFTVPQKQGPEGQAWGDHKDCGDTGPSKTRRKEHRKNSPAGRNPSAILLSVSITLSHSL